MEWQPCDPPNLEFTRGLFVRVDPFVAERDATDLFAAIAGAANDDLWRFIPFGPPDSADQLAAVFAFMARENGWRTHVFRSAESRAALGTASYMRIRPEFGSAEVGCVIFAKLGQRTAAATEAMFLMARHLFEDLGYRRYEWKCDHENAASMAAALRLGFSAEGVFRQDMVVRGKNRDSAWFSMLDREWPRIGSAFRAWLAPENFDEAGRQQRSLREFRSEGVTRA